MAVIAAGAGAEEIILRKPCITWFVFLYVSRSSSSVASFDARISSSTAPLDVRFGVDFPISRR